MSTRKLTWTFREAIRVMRESTGLQQGELAAMIGVSRNSIGNWESGRSVPPQFATVRRLAHTCGYTDDDEMLLHLWSDARDAAPLGSPRRSGCLYASESPESFVIDLRDPSEEQLELPFLGAGERQYVDHVVDLLRAVPN